MYDSFLKSFFYTFKNHNRASEFSFNLHKYFPLKRLS